MRKKINKNNPSLISLGNSGDNIISKELPNDTSIEQAVIGALIRYPHKYSDVSKYIISDDVWYNTKCRNLWKIISSMVRNREHIDMITVSSNLTEGDYINGLDNVFIVDCTENCGS